MSCLGHYLIIPVNFDTFIVTWFIWYFQESSSSIYNPKNLVYLTCSICCILIIIDIFCWSFLSFALKIMKLVLFTFRDNLFANRQVAIFFNSWFTILNRTVTSRWLKSKFVSSAKRTNDSNCEHLYQLKKLELHSEAIASCNSYASFVLSKLPACIHNSTYAR